MDARLRGGMFAFACLLQSALAVAQEPPRGPSPDTLASNAAIARARFEGFEPASWVVLHEANADTQFVVHAVQAGGHRRLGLSLQKPGEDPQAIVKVVERDGFWYVDQGNARGKYRPYEAPIFMSTAYYYLLRSKPVFLDAGAVGRLGVFQEGRGGHFLFRTPVTEAERARFAGFLMDANRRLSQTPPEQQEALRAEIHMVQGLMNQGIPVQVREDLGVMEAYGTPGKRTRLLNFKWLDTVDEREFVVDGGNWEDHTGDPTAADPGNLVMLGHCGWWRPGVQDYETDIRLLDVVTGKMRRVPYQGPIAQPGCFLPGRTRVAVTGLDAAGTSMGLYEVDLKTGANRRLGGELLADGWCAEPTLSPDGTALAVIHKTPRHGPNLAELCTVDLATGEARRVRDEMDVSSLSWDPSGDGWILFYRRADAPEEESGVICHLNRDGQLLPLRKGEYPVVLDDRRILYWAEREGGWMECDLRGKNPVRFADGLVGHGHPAVAPDGRRMIFMKYADQQPPVPLLMEIGVWNGAPITRVPGLWGTPRWR